MNLPPLGSLLKVSQIEFLRGAPREQAFELQALLSDIFGADTTEPLWIDRIGLENLRCLSKDKTLIGGCGLIPFGHFFGEQRVSAVGIGGVGVAPERRGDGSATMMMTRILEELYSQGVALSSLYPATVKFYRRVGYEFAGQATRIKLPLDRIDARERELELEQVEPTLPTIRELYRSGAKKQDGNLDRSDFNWHGITHDGDKLRRAYLIHEQGKPAGYLIYNHMADGGPPAYINVIDWQAQTPGAAKRLLTFLADHRTVRRAAYLVASPQEWLFSLLGEYSIEYQRQENWMLRVVHVPRALEERGYPKAVRAELHLRIHDDILPGNEGDWVLTVSDGRGSVQAGGRGEIEIDVRGLASLYAGYHTVTQLSQIGTLGGAQGTPLDTVFSGPCAWIRDWF